MNTIWHNGALKDDAALISASDLALRGAGVFDTMLVIDGQLIHADPHVERLKKHAALFNLEIKYDLITAAQELAKGTQGRQALNTTITAGHGSGLNPSGAPNIFMRLRPLPDELPPIHAIIAQSVRRNEGSPLSQIKSLNYGDNILALNEAKAAGANEAIMLNNAGHIACATIGNIFILQGEILYTPPLSDGAMDGITRALLIQNHGAQEKPLAPEDIKSADGIYLTNTIRGLQAIEHINSVPIAHKKINIPKDFHIR